MKMKYGFVWGAVLGLATTRIALADPTALELVKKKGNNYVGVQSKDKVLEIYSDKSVAKLQPNVWNIVYYDPSVTFKSVDVKFRGAGEEMEVSHSMHGVHGACQSAGHPRLNSGLKLDSNQGLAHRRIATVIERTHAENFPNDA